MPLACATVDASGATLKVDKPGDPLDGLSITVPAGANAQLTTFHVSYQPIQRHGLGEDFEPIVPMILVENGGAYSAEVMEVRIPVKIGANYFAMPFVCADVPAYAGEAEVLAMLDKLEASVRAAIRRREAN